MRGIRQDLRVGAAAHVVEFVHAFGVFAKAVDGRDLAPIVFGPNAVGSRKVASPLSADKPAPVNMTM